MTGHVVLCHQGGGAMIDAQDVRPPTDHLSAIRAGGSAPRLILPLRDSLRLPTGRQMIDTHDVPTSAPHLLGAGPFGPQVLRC